MKLKLRVLFLLLLVSTSQCNVQAPCNILDSSCDPIRGILLERLLSEGKYTLQFDPPEGSYEDSIEVKISIPFSDGGEIRYNEFGEADCVNDYPNAPIYLPGGGSVANMYTIKAAYCKDGKVRSSGTASYAVKSTGI